MANAPADKQRRLRRSITLGPDPPTSFAVSLFLIVVTFSLASPLLEWMRHWLRD